MLCDMNSKFDILSFIHEEMQLPFTNFETWRMHISQIRVLKPENRQVK